MYDRSARGLRVMCSWSDLWALTRFPSWGPTIANDAAMTQQPADPRRALGAASKWFEGSLSQQQESLLSAMSGSFHPTFEAQAIMGWSVGEALITALDAPAPPIR